MNINDMLGNEPVMQDRSPKGQIFSIEAEIKNLMQEYDMVVQDKNSQGAFGSNKRAQMIADKIDQLQQQKIGIQSQMGDENMTDAMRYFFKTDPPGFDRDRMSRIEIEMEEKAKKQKEEYQRFKKRNFETIPELAGGGEASSQHMMPDGTPMPGSNHQEYEAMMMQQRQMMAGGGTPFPDLTGDGQITQADILKGRGVYAEGDEVMDVNNLPEDIKQKVENIYRKLYLSNPDIERNRRRPNTASLTDEENELLDQYAKGKLRRDVPLLSKYMDMIGMDDIVNDNPFLQGLKIASTSLGMAGAMPTSRIRGAMNPELGIGNSPIFDKVMEERKETYGYAEGGETIDDELEGMEMTEEQAMAEVGVAEKEMQMIQQLVAVVQQLIAEGLGEKDIVAFLKEQGLDDEDIDSLMQMVLQAQSGQAPEGIDQQLQGMM